MWKNIRQQYKNNNLKIIAPMWNGEFELPDGSYSLSDIQTNTNNYPLIHRNKYPRIHTYINRINNKLAIKIKEKLELQTPETMKLLGSTKKLIDKAKNRENAPSLELVEVFWNLVDNQYQQKYEVLHTFTPNKNYGFLLILESNKLVFLKIFLRQ